MPRAAVLQAVDSKQARTDPHRSCERMKAPSQIFEFEILPGFRALRDAELTLNCGIA